VIDALYRLAKPALFQLDPETVHDRTIAALGRMGTSSNALALLGRGADPVDPRLAVSFAGVTLPGPIGIAAGLDKNGIAYPALAAMGWDSIEIGTVTRLPQPGNSKPRIFRLTDNRALINRMGFPGAGVDAVAMNLIMRRKRPATIGINIGPNKGSVEAGLDAVIADCQDLVRRLSSLCTYLVLNVSSPNTARLRNLQGKAALAELLTAVRSSSPRSHATPLLVKIAPDLTPSEIDDIIDVVLETGLEGVIATNTTTARPPILQGKWCNETGGLSGEPLRSRSLDVIRQIAIATKGTLPIIGVGGIASGTDALAVLRAGAWSTQSYTGMIYQGPGLARAIKRSLSAELDRTGMTSLKELREESLRL